MSRKIWLPDNQTATVQWYITDAKALGIEEIRDEWAARPIRSKPLGYWVGDPDRDDELPEFRA